MTQEPRLHVTSDLRQDGYLALEEAQAKYLTRVMRLGIGDTVRVFNGRDGEWRASIDTVEGRSVLTKVIEPLRAQTETTNLLLLFAPLKKTNTDFLVEKSTELGATRLQPVMTERTNAARVRTDRLQRTALEAAEQTERMDVPIVDEAIPLEAAVQALPEDIVVVFCDEVGAQAGVELGEPGGDVPALADALQAVQSASGAILIGPEGGFSGDERAWLRARENVIAVSLGPRILRAETAAVSALTLWQALRGDWR